MDDGTYRSWRRQVDERLEQLRSASGAASRGQPRLPRQIRAVMGQARQIAEAVDTCLPSDAVLDKNKYDFVLSMLPQILSFDDFVLCEYTYALAGGARPGIRLLLELGPAGRQISVVLFEDVRRWQVDRSGQKVSYQLLALLLDREEITPHVASESAEYFEPAWDWRQHLCEALCVPLRLLEED